MSKKFSKPELSRQINGDIPFDAAKKDDAKNTIRFDMALRRASGVEQIPLSATGYPQTTIQRGGVRRGERAPRQETVVADSSACERFALPILRAQNRAGC